MRQVALDTETTGMDVTCGHRVIEIGCVEIVQRTLTGHRFHSYLNPQRESETGALQVHGLTQDFLADKPLFADIADEFLDFVDGAELLIHNASFDLGFLDHELCLAGRAYPLDQGRAVIDTLKLARELHPGQRNSLDALCKRYQVDHSARSYHGALLDARLLAEVYLAMTAGQGSLALDVAAGVAHGPACEDLGAARIPRRIANAAECALHDERVAALERKSGAPSLWRQWIERSEIG